MSEVDPNGARLEEARGLRRHEHLCLIYDTEEERCASASRYIRAGLARGEKCLYIADDASAVAVTGALRHAGIDVDRYLDSGALVLAPADDASRRPEQGDPDRWIEFLSQATQDADAGRFSGLRTLLAESTWALGDDAAAGHLLELEAKLNHFVLGHNAGVVCQYNRRRVAPALIHNVLRTHPVIVYGGIISRNPYYVPPDEFLQSDPAWHEVDRLLKDIHTWEHSLTQLRALAGRLQTVREEERTTAAREIHDGLGQALTAIKLEFAALLRDLPAEEGVARQRSQSILTLLDDAIQSVRRISTELRPGILDDLGLMAATEWAAEVFEARTGTRVEVDLPARELVLEREYATALFRILQETLTNVARHAKATHVSVRLAEKDRMVTLEVQDNGEGIGDERAAGHSSLGLLGMLERALLLGGTLTITGARGTGTTVTVRIPIPPHARGDR